MASRRSELAAGSLVLAFAVCLPAAASAQAAPAPAPPVALTTPDGSRFVLVVEPSMPHVHWAVATYADGRDDPPGLPGLTQAVMKASLGGTWQIGSRDVEKEREALTRLDAIWQQHAAGGDAAPALVEVQRCADQALALADPQAFLRVLATMPADRPELVERDGATVLVLTTLADAIGDVARLLVERREDQALRDLPRLWQAEVEARSKRTDAAGDAALHAELLAMAVPERPAPSAAERRANAAPRYEQAFAVWAATQRPERTVHVLLGGFDVASVTATLNASFATTALPPYAAPPVAIARPLAGMRRSVVSGVSPPTLAVAWPLPADADRAVLAAATTWLAGGADSRIGRELQRSGRTSATTVCRAPWPANSGSAGNAGGNLLAIEITDASAAGGSAAGGGVDGLLDLVLRTCRDAAANAPDPAGLKPVLLALQRAWRERCSDPRARAVELAADTLASPDRTPRTAGMDRVDGAAIHALLSRTFAGQPIAVEGKP